MDLLNELEHMVANVSLDQEATDTDITRWQKLFGFSAEHAQRQIESFRSDLGKTTISEELWSTLAAEQEPLGFDKEAFEFFLTTQGSHRLSNSAAAGKGNVRGTYLIKLDGPLDSVESVQSVLGLQRPPEKLLAGSDEVDHQNTEAVFCKVSASERFTLLQYIAQNYPRFQLTSARLAKAIKDLGTHSRAPSLGRDVEWSLPHLKPAEDVVQRPAQEEYPIWYFFYGKLADPQILRSLLTLSNNPVLVPATVQGGKIRTWGGKYNALVDAGMNDRVTGSAFQVMTQEQEEALLFFETDMYEVVRCSISMDGGSVDGLVFRYCGDEEQLS